MVNADCFICSKHRGDISIPGGVVFEDDLVYASHSMISQGQYKAYLGYLIIEPKRHVAGLEKLNKQESESLGVLISRLSQALIASEDAEHIYLFVLGHHSTHLHYHLVPRYANTPEKWWGIHLDEWPEAPRGGIEEISSLCDRLRSYLSGNPIYDWKTI
jgi:diadenosine tetraphosphate (Ap4A) HIT family hydrolase